MVNNLFNLIGLFVVLGLAVNTVWMSMLVYAETRLLSSRTYPAEKLLTRIRQHCRIIGVSVMVMPVLAMLVGADLTFQLIQATQLNRDQRESDASNRLAANENKVTLSAH